MSLLSIMNRRGLSMRANSDAQTVLLVTENKKKTPPDYYVTYGGFYIYAVADKFTYLQ